MRPLILDVATVIGLLVMALVGLSVVVFIVDLFAEARRERRGRFVPREWVDDELRRRRRDHPSQDGGGR